jgi:hypothetical protein
MKKEELQNIVPGFTMGIVRAIISHPFEILKMKSQINQYNYSHKNIFKGIQYSIISNALERGIQFGLYEKFRLNDGNIISSIKASVISTMITLPYNIILLKKVILNSSISIKKNIFYKTTLMEFIRNMTASILFLSSYNYLKNDNYPIFLRAPMSSCFVWVVTYPLDTYKNILISGKNINKLNIINLYRGLQYPLIRSIPSSIIGFYVYEYMLKIIN